MDIRDVPPGDHGGALRVLVESDRPAAEISDYAEFRLAGLDVSVCSGPGDVAEDCPLVRGESCRFAERADAVLVELDLSQPAAQRVVDALAARHPGTPVVVLPSSASVDEQIDVMRRAALEGRRARDRVARDGGSPRGYEGDVRGPLGPGAAPDAAGAGCLRPVW
jgi:hypothetical protein